MKTIAIPIGNARADLCKLVRQVAGGNLRVLLTAHGRPKAQLLSYRETGAPWRLEKPDDPQRYGDSQSPIMEPWR